METTDTARSDTVVLDRVQFIDVPAQKHDFLYKIINGFDLDETNAKSYNVIMTFTRGQNF